MFLFQWMIDILTNSKCKLVGEQDTTLYELTRHTHLSGWIRLLLWSAGTDTVKYEHNTWRAQSVNHDPSINVPFLYVEMKLTHLIQSRKIEIICSFHDKLVNFDSFEILILLVYDSGGPDKCTIQDTLIYSYKTIIT